MQDSVSLCVGPMTCKQIGDLVGALVGLCTQVLWDGVLLCIYTPGVHDGHVLEIDVDGLAK